MKDLFPKFALKQLSTYLAIIVIFIHNVVLDKDLQCSCEQQTLVCIFYMIMPFFILFVLQLWTDKKFKRAWKYTCPRTRKCTCTCTKQCCKERLWRVFCIFLHHIIKAVFIGLLWVVSVLIDGDWYVCCWNDQSKQQKQLACKAETDMTAMDRKIIAELKDWSWVIGISLLFCSLVSAALISSFGWMKCCEDSKFKKKYLYHRVVLDQEKIVLKEVLTKAAKDTLTEAVEDKISGDKWDGCYDVAEELIKNPKTTRPTLKAEENQEQGIRLGRVRPEDKRQEESKEEDMTQCSRNLEEEPPQPEESFDHGRRSLRSPSPKITCEDSPSSPPRTPHRSPSSPVTPSHSSPLLESTDQMKEPRTAKTKLPPRPFPRPTSVLSPVNPPRPTPPALADPRLRSSLSRRPATPPAPHPTMVSVSSVSSL
ncbi:stress response protein nst1-like [Micropterus dolomieu]|nr:stress response protein nst1-like [Micropterus dolomieu]